MDEFKKHCQEILESCSEYVSSKVAKLTGNIDKSIKSISEDALTQLQFSILTYFIAALSVVGVGCYALVLITNYFAPKLHSSIANGDIKTIKKLIKSKANLNAIDEEGRTPLNLAISLKNTQAIDLLIKGGADVHTKDKGGNTSLHWVIAQGLEKKISLLINRGADVDARNDQGLTPLHLAALYGNEQAIKLLIDKGAKVDDKNDQGLTPLHLAVLLGNKEAMTLLTNHMVDFADGTQTALKVIDIDTPKSNTEIIELLKKHAYTQDADQEGRKSLDFDLLAASSGIEKLFTKPEIALDSIDKHSITNCEVPYLGGSLE